MENKLLENYYLNEAELKLLEESQTDAPAAINISQTISLLYLAITIENSSNKLAQSNYGLSSNIGSMIGRLITSNSKLSETNDRRSKAMNWLTLGLVLIGIIQLIIAFTNK
jgi:hypothetical protein